MVLIDFCHFFLLTMGSQIFPWKENNVTKMYQKGSFVIFVLHFCFGRFPIGIEFGIQNVTKMWQYWYFAWFLSHFWNEFCHNLNTISNLVTFLIHLLTFLLDLCDILGFDSFLLQYEQNIVTFLPFVTFLSQFCYIFVTFLK